MAAAALYLPCACSCRICLLLRLGEGDDAVAHPRQDFWRWAPGLDGSDCRPSAKFFFVLVSYPACPIAALGGDVRQLRMPPHAFVRIGRFNRPTFLVDAGKLALGEDDRIGSALRQKATMRTCFAAGAQSTALAAFDQPRNFLLVTLSVCRVFGPLGDVERPLDRVFEQ